LKISLFTLALVLHFSGCSGQSPAGNDEEVPTSPPFSGTIFIDPDIVTSEDPTSFTGLDDAGTGTRTMYDRRVEGWITVEACLFIAHYSDGDDIEIQVNPEFGTVESALLRAEKYGPVIGRLPAGLRRDVDTVWVHRGTNPFGGGNRNLLIHTGQSAEYESQGILEETLVHEASHTSLDARTATTSEWRKAQEEDPVFISTYARDNPTREDVAETWLAYFAVRYRRDRISDELYDKITAAIPNRLKYFEEHPIDLSPQSVN
jgi:hypothetical protein